MWLTPSRRQVDIVVAVVVLALFPSNHFRSSNMAATGKVLVVVALFMLPIVAHGLFPCYFLSLCMLFRRSYFSQRLIYSSKNYRRFWEVLKYCFVRTHLHAWHPEQDHVTIEVALVGFKLTFG